MCLKVLLPNKGKVDDQLRADQLRAPQGWDLGNVFSRQIYIPVLVETSKYCSCKILNGFRGFGHSELPGRMSKEVSETRGLVYETRD